MSGTSRRQVGGVRPAGTGPASRVLTAAETARLAAIAGRAPSVHNTQPWRVRAAGAAVDVLADPLRQLRQIDPDGRELLISCGAALFGLRLGFRALGCTPAVELLPDPDEPDLIARVRVAGQAAITRHESELLTAVYHRHTHRGPFSPGELAVRLVDGLRTDAITERAELTVIADQAQTAWIGDLVRAAAREQAATAEIAAELRRWTPPPESAAHDGVPAFARGQPAIDPGSPEAGSAADLRLPQRDFGEPGTAPGGGSPPALTAVLSTASDTRADWIQAGQALHRILLHAATRWVFATLQSQPLEVAALRAELSARLQLPGAPQMLLQFGRANTAGPTPRRPVDEILA